MTDSKKPTRAANIMNTRVETFSPNGNIRDAVETLLRRGYSGAPVCDDDGNCVGVLSEHDCIRVLTRAAYEDWPVGEVEDHMTKDLVSVDVNDDLFKMADLFASRKLRRLPVLDDGKLVGLVTRQDLLRALDADARESAAHHPASTYDLLRVRWGS